MKCPKCKTNNPEMRKFCRECGAKLVRLCPKCDSENLPEDKFCGECGQKLDQAVREKDVLEAEGERKYVTVLFSDLSGFTSLSEELDPEEVKEVVSRIFGEIAQIVANYEGFIEKYIGDAIMALFGAPKAHEDDPTRAVRAAMDINDLIQSISPEIEGMIGKPIMMHSGINTGLVVIGEVNLEKGTHGALGDTINLAARLMNLARPGEIVLGRDTYRQVKDLVSLEKMVPVRVKGKAEEIQSYRVIGLRSEVKHADRALRGRMMSPIVGRDAELSVLYYCLERLLTGKGSIVSIIGEAGIGKSRLIEDSYHYAKKNDNLDRVQWLQGNTLSYGRTISYWPFLEIFRDYSGITEEDDETTAWEKLETKIVHMFGNTADEVLPYIAGLMNLEPKGQYEEAVPFLQRALELAESIPDYIARSEIGALLGQCYLYEEEHQKALEILEESERINTEHRIPVPMTNLMHSLAEAYLAFAEKEKKNKTDWMHKARHACKQALKAGKGSKAKLPHTAR